MVYTGRRARCAVPKSCRRAHRRSCRDGQWPTERQDDHRLRNRLSGSPKPDHGRAHGRTSSACALQRGAGQRDGRCVSCGDGAAPLSAVACLDAPALSYAARSVRGARNPFLRGHVSLRNRNLSLSAEIEITMNQSLRDKRKRKLRYADENRRHQNPAEIVLLGRIYEEKLPAPRWQYPVCGFIADFAWPSSRLVVEVDGPYHETDAQRAADTNRTRGMEKSGWVVRRITNAEIFTNPLTVIATLREWLDASSLRTRLARITSADFQPCWTYKKSKTLRKLDQHAALSRDMNPRLIKHSSVGAGR